MQLWGRNCQHPWEGGRADGDSRELCQYLRRIMFLVTLHFAYSNETVMWQQDKTTIPPGSESDWKCLHLSFILCVHTAKTMVPKFTYGGSHCHREGKCSKMQTFATSYLAVSFGLLSSIIFVVSVMLWVCSRETHPFQVWQWPRQDCQQRLEQMLKRTHSEL